MLRIKLSFTTIILISVLFTGGMLTFFDRVKGELPDNLPPIPSDVEDIFVTYCRTSPHENMGEHLENLGLINSTYKDWNCDYVYEKREKMQELGENMLDALDRMREEIK